MYPIVYECKLHRIYKKPLLPMNPKQGQYATLLQLRATLRKTAPSRTQLSCFPLLQSINSATLFQKMPLTSNYHLMSIKTSQ